MNSSLHKLIPFGIMVVSGAFFAGIFYFAIIPFQEKIIGKANTIEANRALQDNQEERVGELPKLREQYDFIVQNEIGTDVLVSHDQMVPFIEHLERLAHERDSEITITDQSKNIVKKKPAVNAKKPAESDADSEGSATSDKKKKDETILGNLPLDKYMSLRLDIRGEYAEVALFLHQLESLPYAVEVVALDIQKLKEEAPEAKKQSVPAPSVPGSPDTPAPPEEEPVVKNRVQGLFDIIVYTKD